MILKRISEPNINTVGFWCLEGWTWPWKEGDYCRDKLSKCTPGRLSPKCVYVAPYELSSWRE